MSLRRSEQARLVRIYTILRRRGRPWIEVGAVAIYFLSFTFTFIYFIIYFLFELLYPHPFRYSTTQPTSSLHPPVRRYLETRKPNRIE